MFYIFALQDNEDLRTQMAKMEETLAALSLGGNKPSNGKPKKTPPPNPKVKSKPAKSSQPPMDDPSGDEPEPETETDGDDELSDAAKKARLRRLCERKSTGKLKVPEEVHQLWRQGGHARDELCRILEESSWDQDCLAWFTLESLE